MISREQFVEVIEASKNTDDFLSRLWANKIDLIETDLYSNYAKIEFILFESNFTEEACETIMWWLYEYSGTGDAMWDSEGTVIPMETVEDLWNYVKNERK